MKKAKCLVSLMLALGISCSVAIPSSAATPVYKNRTCTVTYGTQTGTSTYTSYYQTAIDVESNYYKMDGYAEVHQLSTSSLLRSFSAQIVSYYSGATGADDTIYKSSTGAAIPASTWTADSMAFTCKALDYYQGSVIKSYQRKDYIYSALSAKNFSGFANALSSTDKINVMFTLEASCDYASCVSFPNRIL
ncbi:MAG: hypothetical protein QM689_00320 [Oscillospiraceae bacterium]